LRGKVFYCPGCGFTYYHNVAAAAGCFVDNGRGILFLTRAREPQRGRLDVPGGFVEPGEGLLEGLRRECREETGLDFAPERARLLASFPNRYPYKGIDYNTCDVFFTVRLEGLEAGALKIEREEVCGADFIGYEDINIEDLAFPSTKMALRVLMDSPGFNMKSSVSGVRCSVK